MVYLILFMIPGSIMWLPTWHLRVSELNLAHPGHYGNCFYYLVNFKAVRDVPLACLIYRNEWPGAMQFLAALCWHVLFCGTFTLNVLIRYMWEVCCCKWVPMRKIKVVLPRWIVCKIGWTLTWRQGIVWNYQLSHAQVQFISHRFCELHKNSGDV